MAQPKPAPKPKEIHVEFIQPDSSVIAFANRFSIEEQPFHLLTVFGFTSHTGDQECSHCVALDFRALEEHRQRLLQFFSTTAPVEDEINPSDWIPRKLARSIVAADFIQASRIGDAGELSFYCGRQHAMIDGGKAALKSDELFQTKATCVAHLRLNTSMLREWIFKIYEIYASREPNN